ncbi:phenazine-1-carboxylate N-methyltransferase PhzM [Streptosporangium oxazolinicum]|uniref:Phenazine-1-carboxylate N-methyltransferase PhzM n=1 Tax=Streptosporangium oxazolinicum TaxID=909287 RepID=A0ABP8AN39_9ACTN
MIEMITGGWRAQALYTAVKLGLPDHIEAGRTTCGELAESTGAQEEGIHRLMRLLVAMGVFEGNERTGYRNTAMGAALLDGPQSLRDMCLLHGEEYYTAWSHAPHAISTVSSGFEVAYGQSFYSYLSHDKDIAKRFQRNMNTANMFFDQVPEIFDFSGKKVVDVGGGGGQLLTAILGATPDARGTLFDREHMMPAAREHLAATVGLDRVELVAGDMFEAVPAGGDVYILCRVLAGWEDDAVVEVFENCRRAMEGSSSRLLVIDRLVVDEDSTVLPALWDLQLLMITGGQHRTLDRFTEMLDRAGLDVERVAELPMETTAMIAAPRP